MNYDRCNKCITDRHFMGLVGFEGIYGKTVFLTYEETEAALKGEKNNEMV